ncbi:hypothetical protein BJ875DRAFT_211746 [Amylocarpus encephaloides]|uniref:Uncharacterized protein n=1 Tax=Amylocarpus encephaloides TaxID=45428 RepID=A0A9P7Y8G8_9HELO|nr:hypothetical protein BJ875DRAFT_211746 [Amylocarpus encephaloides]
MVSDGPRDVEFVPLQDFEVEDTAGALHGGNERHIEHRSEASIGSAEGTFRAICWAVCSLIAISTTKRLMINHGFHYPLAISFRVFATLSVVYMVGWRLGAESTRDNTTSTQWGIRRPRMRELLATKYWVGLLPASLSAAASLPMLLEGILHMPSLPVLVMVFPVIYAAESLVLFVSRSQPGSPRCPRSEAVIIVAASSLVLYNECRLMVPGLIWGLLGILFIGISRALLTLGLERGGPDVPVHVREKQTHAFVIMTLEFGLISSGISGYKLEHMESIYSTSHSTIILMVINIISFIGTSFAGTSLLAYSPITFEGSHQSFSNIPVAALEALPALLSSLAIILVAVASNPVPAVSWIQIFAFLASATSLVGLENIHVSSLCIRESRKRRKAEKGTSNNAWSVTGLLVLVIITSSVISFFAASTMKLVTQGMPSSLDLSYKPASRFDIVVSMYDEDPDYLRRTLEAIKSTAMLSTLKPNIIVYTKNPDADLAMLKQATGANVVEKMDNVGREGGTYLQHIVNKWDKLAEQTMFIQAHAHNMRELIPRINDYLVPETGMLSLGFTGVQCDCEACGDRWGWEDKYTMVPDLFKKIYKQPCKTGAPILLAYKGQFVASARRIRGIDKDIFKDLMVAINSKDGWSHDTTIVGDHVDRPDNPYFGFTVERIWGLLLQCATDGSVAAKCPSLLSGMGRWGEVGNCQCLDR